MVKNPELSVESKASILSMEGETALYCADTTLARERHAEAGKLLQLCIRASRTSKERNLRRFLTATQYFKGGLYSRAMKFVRRIEHRLLPEHVKHLFPTFRNEVKRRARPEYKMTVWKRLAEYQQNNDYRKITAMLWHHPYAYDRIGVAFLRAYACMRLKEYRTAGTFASAAYRFGLSEPARVMELTSLPYQAEIESGLEEGSKAAKNFAKTFPHTISYLVAASILYRIALSRSAESRRELAREQLDYYDKAIVSYQALSEAVKDHEETRQFFVANSASAAIAKAWLGELTQALAILDQAESAAPRSRDLQNILNDARRFIKSLDGTDLLSADPQMIVPIDSMISRITHRQDDTLGSQIKIPAA